MMKSILVLFGAAFVFLASGYQAVDSKIDGGDFTCDTVKLHNKSCHSEVPGCYQDLKYCLAGAAPDRKKLCTDTGGSRACEGTIKSNCLGGVNHDILSTSSCDTPTPTPAISMTHTILQ